MCPCGRSGGRAACTPPANGSPLAGSAVQGYLAHKKAPPRMTLQYCYAQGPVEVLGGGGFLMKEVPL